MSSFVFPRFASGAVLGALLCIAGAAAAQTPDMPPKLDSSYPNRQPGYPDGAQLAGEQGNVILSVNVMSSGRVRGVKVLQSSGFEDLDNAAIGAVLGWRYHPAVIDGDTSSDWTQVTISYRLPTAAVVPATKTSAPAAPAPHAAPQGGI